MKTYSIKEIAELTSLNPSTIRYYESTGLLINIKRDNSGRRVFTDENIRWIEFIKRGKATGMSIKKLVEYGKLLNQGDSTALKRRKILSEHLEHVKEEIKALNEMKEYIEYKLEYYDKLVGEMSLK